MTRKLHLALLGAVFLAACDGGGGGGGDGDGGGGGNINAKIIQNLGLSFFQAFSLDRNDEPVDAQSVQLELTPRAKPFNP